MNFFKKMFSWFSDFFVVFSKTAIATLAEELAPKIRQLVTSLEGQNLSGQEKADNVVSFVKTTYGQDISGVVINLAINMVLAVVRDRLKS